MRLVDLVSVRQLSLDPSKSDATGDESDVASPSLLSPRSSSSSSSTKELKGFPNGRCNSKGKLCREKSSDSIELNEGKRRRHIWESIKASPPVTHSKCSSHCRHANRNRIYSTDEDSEVGSSYPASPIKSSMLRHQHSQEGSSYANAYKSLYNSFGNYSHDVSFKELVKNRPITPEEDLETDDVEQLFNYDKDLGIQGHVSSQPKLNSSGSLKSKSLKSKDRMKSNDGYGDTVKPFAENWKSRLPSFDEEDKAFDVISGAKPKIKNVKDASLRNVTANRSPCKGTSKVHKKPASNTGNQQIVEKEVKQNSSNMVDRLPINSESVSSRKPKTMGVTKKNSLWSKVKSNAPVVIEKPEFKPQASEHSNQDMHHARSPVKSSKSKRGWDNVKKRVGDSTTVKNKQEIDANNLAKVSHSAAADKEKETSIDTSITKNSRLSQRRGSFQMSGGKRNKSPCNNLGLNLQSTKSSSNRNYLKSGDRSNSLNAQENDSSNRNDTSPSDSKNNTLTSQGSKCSSKNDSSSNSRRNSICSLQGSRCNSRNGFASNSRRNSIHNGQGSRSDSRSDFPSSSRRNSMHSLQGSRCSTRSDSHFLYVNDNVRSSSSLSTRSFNSSYQGSKSDTRETSPVPGLVWNPYFNSKIVVASKPQKNFENSKIVRKKKGRISKRNNSFIVKGVKEECSGNDSSDDYSGNKIGELTIDNVQSTEVFRNRPARMRRGKRYKSGSVNSLPGYRESNNISFERDSAIGSMNSLGKEKNYGDPLSSSLRSLDSWEYPGVNLNRGTYNDSIKSLDELPCSSKCRVTSKKGFSSLIDIKDYMRGNMHNLKEESFDGLDLKDVSQKNCKLPKRESSRENITSCSKWGSLSKLSRGLESVQQCIEDKTTRWQPELNANSSLSSEFVKKNASKGWESIRRKILEKDWKSEEKKTVSSFRSGGGEEESEWFVTKEEARANKGSNALGVEIQRSRSLSGRRAPKFSELFGSMNESQGRGARSTYSSEDLRLAEKRSKSLGRSRSRVRSRALRNKDEIDSLKEKQKLQTAILRSIQDSAVSDTEGEESPVEGLESGLGSSFDEGSDNNMPVEPEPEESPSHPEKVYAAITNYLMTVDQMESDEDVDNFNREAEGFDPEELILLTDHEDNLTWEDLIVCYNMSPVHVPKSKNAEDKKALNDTLLDALVPDIKVSSESQSEDLDMILGSDCDYDWQSLVSEYENHFPTKTVDTDTKEIGAFNSVICAGSETSQTELEIQDNESDANEGELDIADSDHEEEVETLSWSPPEIKDTINSIQQELAEVTLDSDDDDTQSISSNKLDDDSTSEVEEILEDPPTSADFPLKNEATEESPSQEIKNETQKTDAAVDTERGRIKERENQSDSEVRERSVSCSENIRSFMMTQTGVKSRGDIEPIVLEGKDNCKYQVISLSPRKEMDNLVPPRPPPVSAVSQERAKTVQKKKATDTQKVNKKPTKTGVLSKFMNMFCTTPVTVEGISASESQDTDPEPLPPPIPPHAVDPEIMTADEADRLLSAKEGQSILSDEEAQEVVLLLSPPNEDASKVLPPPPPPIPPHHGEGLSSMPPHYDIPPAVPPHYADVTPPVPPHFGPSEDEFDTRVASHFDPTLASPLSPEDEPSEADSSEETGDIGQVSRVKEVLVEDGVHYLEDGHFWVEVPGLPEDDDEEDIDPTLPFHPHTKLSFSKEPIQVFSTYSVTEYDRKNDEVDPVAASAEYELEKRVEKMDLFPVEIIKGEGGLGLSIIGMGVGADAGVEKLGIFVKTITSGGATERDGRIQVNDQIIEVDGKSLVGVTQVFAASVLKNTSGRVHFLIGREKDPENSEVALLIKQSLQADREREERRRALGGPDYDPHAGNGLFDPMSSPSEENSRSEEVPQNYSSYLEGGSSPTSPDAVSPPIESFDLEGDTSDTSPENDAALLKLRLKEIQYKNAVAEAEITKLKMTLLEMEKIVTENVQYSSQLSEAHGKMAEMDNKLQSKLSEVSTYQDMLEQSQGQYIILEKKYYKAKKIIKEYQGRERDFLHREEYHITQLEDKDSHYNALVKALKDRVINLEEELKNAQKKAGLPVEVPTDLSVQPAYLELQQNAQSALAKLAMSY